MSDSERLKKIDIMLEADPNDQFLRYSRAMELRGLERFEESQKAFEALMNDDPPHVNAFFMLGQMLAENDEPEQAAEVIKKGIEQAVAQGEAHAEAEMRGFLELLT